MTVSQERHPIDQLGPLATGDLDSVEAEKVSAHVRVCISCREVLTEVVAAHTVLTAAARPEPEPALGARVRAKAARDEMTVRRRRWRLAAAAALLVLVSAAGGWMASRAYTRMATVVHRPSGPAFALVLERDFSVWRDAPRDVRVEWSMQFGRWLGSRALRARSVGGISLRGEAGIVLSTVTTGPVAGAEPTAAATAMTSIGMVVVQVASYDEAAAIAASCPLLAQGGRVLIRRLH